MTQRPSKYTDWRDIMQAKQRFIGMMCLYRMANGRIVMDKALWKALDGLRRVELRMEVEREVMDNSYLQEIMRFLQIDNHGGQI